MACFCAENRRECTESERFRAFAYDELVKRDKPNLDIFWLKDASLEESANLPAPDGIAAGIVEDLEAALEQFRAIEKDLRKLQRDSCEPLPKRAHSFSSTRRWLASEP